MGDSGHHISPRLFVFLPLSLIFQDRMLHIIESPAHMLKLFLTFIPDLLRQVPVPDPFRPGNQFFHRLHDQTVHLPGKERGKEQYCDDRSAPRKNKHTENGKKTSRREETSGFSSGKYTAARKQSSSGTYFAATVDPRTLKISVCPSIPP